MEPGDNPRSRVRERGWNGTYAVEAERVHLPAEDDAAVRRAMAQADEDLAEASIHLRWGRQQLAVVQRAARLAGIDYEAYLKEAAYRRAVEDLRAAKEAGAG